MHTSELFLYLILATKRDAEVSVCDVVLLLIVILVVCHFFKTNVQQLVLNTYPKTEREIYRMAGIN